MSTHCAVSFPLLEQGSLVFMGGALVKGNSSQGSVPFVPVPPSFFQTFPGLGAGQVLGTPNQPKLLFVEKRTIEAAGSIHGEKNSDGCQRCHTIEVVRVRTLAKIEAGVCDLSLQRKGITMAVITLSDKASQGLRVDESGPCVAEMVCQALPVEFVQQLILPDSPQLLQAVVADFAHLQHFDLIITTGGTGLTRRDTTPEALQPLFERSLPGFTQAMMAASLAKTPHAVLSRAVAGIIGNSLVFTLPGSRKAVQENLLAVLSALPHAIDKIHDGLGDCGVTEAGK